MLWLEFSKGIVLAQKYPKSFQQREQLWPCLFVFPLSVLAGHDSNGAAWILARVSLKIQKCSFSMQCEGWLVHSGRSAKQELANFSEKEVKTVSGKERAFILTWTHFQKVIRDPRPQNRWAPSFGSSGSPSSAHPGCNSHPPYSLCAVCLLNMLCKEEIYLWVKVIRHLFSYTVWLWWNFLCSARCDFCAPLYCSVKPFVQQAYPIQPSVTAPISGNPPIYPLP